MRMYAYEKRGGGDTFIPRTPDFNEFLCIHACLGLTVSGRRYQIYGISKMHIYIQREYCILNISTTSLTR